MRTKFDIKIKSNQMMRGKQKKSIKKRIKKIAIRKRRIKKI
jgi:hypothetical protein